MVVVAVNHLLDMVVVIAVVADLPLVSDPVADAGNGACDWHDSLYLSLSLILAIRCATLEMTPLSVRSRPLRCRWTTATRCSAPPAQDALCPGSGAGKGNPNWRKAQLAQGRSAQQGKPGEGWRKTQLAQGESCRTISEWWEREKKRNAMEPEVVALSATGLMATALQS